VSIGRRRYEIVRALGSGAFGTVYKALLTTDRGFVKEVALKIMKDDIQSDLAEEMARRQRDEARLLGLVRHRAILHVDGLVRLNDTWAVVMEYVDGADLHSVLRVGRVPPFVAAEIVAEVAGGLRAAFEARSPDGSPLELIHRDVKPSNIALTSSGGVKLLDFGVARGRFEHREAETTGVLLGTLAYMAPERFDGMDMPAGDIYALGVVLAELLTRKRMSKASGNRERHANIVRSTIHRVRAVCPEPEYNDLVRLLVRMLAYQIEERPSARECERLLREILRTLPHGDLPTWSEGVIAKVRMHAPDPVDDLVGATLVERTDTAVAVSETVPLRRRRWPWLGLGLVVTAVPVALILLLVGVANNTGWRLGFPEPDALDKHVVEPSVQEVPALEVGEEEVPEKVVTPDVGDEPEVEAMARSRESPKPPGPVVEAVIPPAPTLPGRAVGWVDVKGDGVGIRLLGANGEESPGDVPVGTYQVMASFSGGEEMEVGEIQVIENGAVSIFCDTTFQNCRIR
jgi:tRNA A-37 threonylcarbamoyl transferase component Bud32